MKQNKEEILREYKEIIRGIKRDQENAERAIERYRENIERAIVRDRENTERAIERHRENIKREQEKIISDKKIENEEAWRKFNEIIGDIECKRENSDLSRGVVKEEVSFVGKIGADVSFSGREDIMHISSTWNEMTEINLEKNGKTLCKINNNASYKNNGGVRGELKRSTISFESAGRLASSQAMYTRGVTDLLVDRLTKEETVIDELYATIVQSKQKAAEQNKDSGREM